MRGREDFGFIVWKAKAKAKAKERGPYWGVGYGRYVLGDGRCGCGCSLFDVRCSLSVARVLEDEDENQDLGEVAVEC